MKLEKTKFDYVMQGLSLLCLLLTSLYLLFNWGNIDSLIPGHFDSNGMINRMADKSEILITLATGWIMVVGMLIISKFPKIWNVPVLVDKDNQESVYRITKHLLESEMLILSINFSFLSLYPLTSKNMPPYYTPLFLGLVFGVMIIYLIKLLRARS